MCFRPDAASTRQSVWKQICKAVATEIDELEDYHKDLNEGWVRYLAAEYSGGKAPVALASKSRGKKVVGDSDEEQ